LLAFTSAYFFESGLFNELRPLQITKFRSLSQVVSGERFDFLAA
jgi:hypothetical protein